MISSFEIRKATVTRALIFFKEAPARMKNVIAVFSHDALSLLKAPLKFASLPDAIAEQFLSFDTNTIVIKFKKIY